MKRRNLILLLGGASSGALSVGTGAFSSAQVERGVNVNVVEDDRALVGYTSPSDLTVPDDADDDGTLTLVTVQNQFAQNISKVEATAVDVAEVDTTTEPADAVLSDVKAINKAEGTRQDTEDPEHELDPGDEAVIKATPTSHLTAETGYDVEVTVRVEGTGVTAEIFGDTETRRFTVKRTEPAEIESVTFTNRGANVSGASGEYMIDFWFVDKNDQDLEDDIQQTRSWNGSGNITSGDAEENSEVKNRQLLAIRFKETDQTFYRPQCGIEESDIPWQVETFTKANENGNSACNW